jgi:AraC-like DNA-binding protein
MLHAPYSIHFETLDVFPDTKGKKNFFELIFVLSGTGKHCINQHSFSYRENHMFLLAPQDCSKFSIEETSVFFFLRFSNIYLSKNGFSADIIRRLEYILHNASHKPGCILKNQTDKALVRPVVEALIREAVNQDLHQEEITLQLINTLIVIVARNIAKYLPHRIEGTTEERIMEILQYIQNNIYEPSKIRTESICRKFGISENYLGKYFKHHNGETLQSYINNYKAALIEHRLKYSGLRVNEIADELGFTDESHLNKFFKQKRGKSPSSYRMDFQKEQRVLN